MKSKTKTKRNKQNQIAQIASQTRLEAAAKAEAKQAQKQKMIDEAVSRAMAEHSAQATAQGTAKQDLDKFNQAKKGGALAQTKSKSMHKSKKYADVLAETNAMAKAKAEADAQIRTEVGGEALNDASIAFQEKRNKFLKTQATLAQMKEDEEWT